MPIRLRTSCSKTQEIETRNETKHFNKNTSQQREETTENTKDITSCKGMCTWNRLWNNTRYLSSQKVTLCYVTRNVFSSDIFTKEKPSLRAVSFQLEVWPGNNANQDDGRALLNVPTTARLCSLAFIPHWFSSVRETTRSLRKSRSTGLFHACSNSVCVHIQCRYIVDTMEWVRSFTSQN